MIEQFVKANCLSCLFNEDRRVELIPEPFRMQGVVSFRVTYQEYIRYILTLTRTTGIVLAADVEYLRELASSKNPKLYSSFLKDMAFAVLKEVWFAERYNKDASIILPATLDSEPSNVSDLLEFYQYCGESERVLAVMMENAGFEHSIPRRSQNLNLYKLGVLLHYTSNSSVTLKELNLVYDLAEQ